MTRLSLIEPPIPLTANEAVIAEHALAGSHEQQFARLRELAAACKLSTALATCLVPRLWSARPDGATPDLAAWLDLFSATEYTVDFKLARRPHRPVNRPLYHRPVTLNIGDPAPDFTLPDQNGDPLTLSSFRGRRVVVFFYPKAETPGCTTQACGVRDHRADYERADAVVLGVSPDAPPKLAKFDTKHGLGFPLLGDEDHAVAEAYGVWVKKSMYGREYMGNERTTFVIAPDGTVKQVLRQVKPGEHDEHVLEALAA